MASSERGEEIFFVTNKSENKLNFEVRIHPFGKFSTMWVFWTILLEIITAGKFKEKAISF